MPVHMNPAEFLLEIMNTDFATHQEAAHQRLQQLQKSWENSETQMELYTQIGKAINNVEPLPTPKQQKRNFLTVVLALVHRSFIKSYRDMIAYGIRIAMYAGLAIMMGTVWLRLQESQSDIQSYINAIVCTRESTVPCKMLTD